MLISAAARNSPPVVQMPAYRPNRIPIIVVLAAMSVLITPIVSMANVLASKNAEMPVSISTPMSRTVAVVVRRVQEARFV